MAGGPGAFARLARADKGDEAECGKFEMKRRTEKAGYQSEL